jgi:hypothetical protein
MKAAAAFPGGPGLGRCHDLARAPAVHLRWTRLRACFALGVLDADKLGSVKRLPLATLIYQARCIFGFRIGWTLLSNACSVMESWMRLDGVNAAKPFSEISSPGRRAPPEAMTNRRDLPKRLAYSASVVNTFQTFACISHLWHLSYDLFKPVGL